jgi:hypothetical protein
VYHALQPGRLVGNGLHAVTHGGDFLLDALHVGLLLHDEIAMFDQLQPVGRLPHLVLEAVGFHIHLHERPKHVKLHSFPPIRPSKWLKTAAKDVHIIL